MTTDPDKKRSALVPLAALYAPEDGDATRVLEKLRASIDAEAAAHSARAAGRGSRRGLAKLAGLSCIALALVGGMIVRERGAERTSPPATAEAPPTVVATAHSAAANDEPTTAAGPAQDDSPSLPAIPSVPVGALPSVPPPAVTTVPRPSPSSSASPTITPTDTLEREARLLAEARHALAVGESERALTLLDEHARTFPNGLLAGDRAAERIVVLCGLGRDEAAGEAKSFLDGHPKSPHARRIAASCAGQP